MHPAKVLISLLSSSFNHLKYNDIILKYLKFYTSSIRRRLQEVLFIWYLKYFPTLVESVGFCVSYQNLNNFYFI